VVEEIFSLWHLIAMVVVTICFLVDRFLISKQKTEIGLYLVLLVHLAFFSAVTYGPLNDYSAYEEGLRALLSGTHIYGGNTRYLLNFPIIAGSLGLVYRILSPIFPPGADQPINSTELVVVFCVFQTAQLAMIGAGYLLSKKYMERLGLGENVASIVCTVLWLLCGPIYKVVSKGQINLFVLDFFLVSVVLAESKPVLAGMAAAAGSFMKIYPAATAGGAVLARRKKLLIGFALGTVLMLLIQTMLCGVNTWIDFINAVKSFPVANPFVDAEIKYQPSISNAVYIIFRMAAPASLEENAAVIHGLIIVASVLVGCWFIWRIFRRERSYKQLPSEMLLNNQSQYDVQRFTGHATDLVGAGLLLSPHVWPQHYVMALPMIMCSLSGVHPLSITAIVGIVVLMLGNPSALPSPAYLCYAFLKPIGLILLLHSQPPSIKAR